MQKRIKLFLSLLCLPVLFSCDGGDLPANSGNKMAVMMTLEHAGCFKESCHTASGIGYSTNAEDIIYRIEHGENVLFAFTKEDCSACENFFKRAGRYLYRTDYMFYYIKENTKEEADKISKYAVENKLERTLIHPISGGTPSMYIMSKDRIVELAYGSAEDDEKRLTTAFKEYLAESNINFAYLGRWSMLYDHANKYLSLETPTYVLSEETKDDFYENVYPIVVGNKKRFDVLALNSIDLRSYDYKNLCEEAGMDDITGKLFTITRIPTSEEPDYKITIIDDAETYLKENYVSSSL